MASHLFSRPSSAKSTLRARLRRVLLESLERRELMAADIMGYNDLSAPISYTLAGQASQTLAFQTTNDLNDMSPDDVTNYLDTTFGSSGGDVTSRAWFPLIQESYSKWSQQNGLAFSYTSGLTAEGENDALVGEGEAGGPRLLSIAPNSGNIFSFNGLNTITEAPTELVFRFDGATGINPTTITNGIKLIRAGRDGGFTEGNEQTITPGFLNFGENNKIVVMRFASTLPDDLYRVVVVGTDNPSLKETAIRAAIVAPSTASPTLQTRSVDSTPLDTTRDTVDFKLELGALVTAVVPQPVDRIATSPVALASSTASFNLNVLQGDLTSNVVGTSVSLRFVASTNSTTDASYDLTSNRITVNVASGATVNQVAAAINNGSATSGLRGNFSVGTVTNGSNLFNVNDLSTRTVSVNNWALDVKRNQIRVYFNDDNLNPSSATDPKYYQLVRTSDTVSPNDDIDLRLTQPLTVSYDPNNDVAVLTFANPIDTFAGTGTFRLRVGSADLIPSATNPSVVTSLSPGEVGGSAATADTTTIPTLGTSPMSFDITGSIVSPIPLLTDYPGSNDEPGHRDLTGSEESHLISGADGSPQITTYQYNFGQTSDGTQISYGTNATGQPLYSSITPEQKQRVREIFDFYSAYLGVDFVETESSGLTIAVGDMYPLVRGQKSFEIGIAGGGLAIMDGAQIWDNSLGQGSGGTSFFETAMHEIGHLLGLEHDTELPDGTIMRGAGPGKPADAVYPGDQDVVHGQHIYRPDNRDVDMYQFQVTSNPGVVRIETIAERLANSSNLDSYLTLFKKDPTTGALSIVSTNNDYFSSDSFIEARLEPGLYVVGVTASGNQDYNPATLDTGSGAVSQGAYQLRFDYSPDNQTNIVDTSGTALDGDGDGKAGGDFNFWFQAAAPSTGVPTPNVPKTIYVLKGAAGANDGSPANPFNSITLATNAAAPGDIIRVVGSLGADGRLSTTSDNPAYEIGRGGVGNAVLSDGVTLEVPQGVTLMIDARAVFKMGGSRIVAGSRDAGVDNRFSSIQVLGTPKASVLFTSYNDETLGTDTNPLITTAQRGDWGGIEIHNDVDRNEGRGDWERKGIFLNYIANADMRYGGGPITVASPSPVVNPIDMKEARPTLLYNTISLSADSAISADPNSFEETRFTHPADQLSGIYRPDYVRVGPDIRGNTLDKNSINGLFIRVPTLAGSTLQSLNVQARLDDRDITYFLGENLIIGGTPGGAFEESIAPNVSLVQLDNTSTASGILSGTQNYKVTFVDRNGGEGIQSVATAGVAASAAGSITLNNLPPARGDFVSRRLWRSSTGATGTYVLVAELDRETPTYVDTGKNLTAILPGATATINRARTDARLAIDPGIIVKLANSRIEVGFGAQLIAEGTPDHPIIFTSRFDDAYGAGGTFDTTNDGTLSTAKAGDWAGIIARQLSSLSVDSARIAFGGGVASVPGGIVGFNPIEVHQANARIANSTLEQNASGLGTGALEATRDGRGNHDAATIFVKGAQPVIINNIIRNNATTSLTAPRNTAAISIDANSMKAVPVQDLGRETGASDRLAGGLGNYGPLVSGNRLLNDDLNGMRVRGATLTTESIWDDSDIVHILQSEIVVPNFHSYGGLLLKSQSDESLVVKLGTPASGGTVGFTATGTPLDITDRIGGQVQVIGAPGFPVILTSLKDDSVGAGFSSTGQSLKDTNNDGSASVPAAGDWRGIRLDQYSSDRNVDTAIEFEPDQIQDVGVNDVPSAAQLLGGLATSLQAGDENLRLGFTLRGTIASPTDTDVFSFTGTAGTQVWFDIDRTDMALDSILELVDVNGNVIARSDDSLIESAVGAVAFVDPARITPSRVQPMDSNPFAPQNSIAVGGKSVDADFQSINPKDAGFRVVLPGASGFSNTYYLRVRSNGVTEGSYRLQLRLQQQDEIAGSAIRYADVRFATNAVDLVGIPQHSPLLGSASAIQTPSAVISPNLGNLAASDRGSFSLAGEISTKADVDFYQFSLNKTLTQKAADSHISVSIDVDYASDFGGPNTSLWLYRKVGNSVQLVLTGTDSNIADDRAAPGQGADLDDLSRGSFGPLDAYIGTQELPPGDYILAVTNNSQIASELDQYQTATPTNAAIRLQPVTSVARLTADHFNSVVQPETAGSPGTASIAKVPWTLGDVTSFALQSDGTILLVNPNTGATVASNNAPLNVSYADAALAPDGRLVTYGHASNTDAGGAIFTVADTKTGLTFNAGAGTGIQTYTAVMNNNVISIAVQDAGYTMNGLTFFNQGSTNSLMLFGVGSRSGSFQRAPLDNANNIRQPAGPDGIFGNLDDIGDLRTSATSSNVLWKLDPNTGAAINPQGVADTGGTLLTTGTGTQKVSFGSFNSTGTVTGLATIGSTLYAVSDTGEFFVAGLGAGLASIGTINRTTTITDGGNVAFTGLSAGPRDLFPNTLFGITANGTIYAIGTNGVLQPIFAGAATSVRSASAAPSGVVGMDFSPLGTNLWHTTDTLGGEAGHGIDIAIDNSQTSRQNGTTSFYFGWENPNSVTTMSGTWPGNFNNAAAYGNTYNLPGGAHGAIESQPIDLRGISSSDLPTLYFNYNLETEGKQSDLSQSNNDMQDAFRVYGVGDDGVWRLLVTNNSADSGNYGTTDTVKNEFDQGQSQNVDPFNTPLAVQEAFDTRAWRQARVNLAPFAGQSVRLRFEFSTAGTMYTNDPKFGGVELTAVAGSRIGYGNSPSLNTFTVATADQATSKTSTFEFDLGLVLDLPSGGSIQDGISAIKVNTNTLVFSTTSSGTGFINFSKSDTASQIATKVRAALISQLGLTVAVNAERSNILNVSGAAAPIGGSYSVIALPASVIPEVPGVSGSNVRVPVTQAMTAVQIRDAVVSALAQEFNAAGQATNTTVWNVYNSTIRMFRYNVTSAGPLQVATRSGDTYGNTPSSSLSVRSGQALSNAFRGLFIDDVVIGLAERGEMVLNSTAVDPAGQLFRNNSARNYNPTGFLNAGGNPLADIETGRYQVEIRLSAEYGNDKGGEKTLLDLTNPPTDPIDVAPRVFNSNDRLSQSIGLDVSAGSAIADGTTFTLSDSVNESTFEFDVRESAQDTFGAGVTPGNIIVQIFSSDTAAQVATKIRNAINSQSSVKLSASVDGEMLSAPNVDRRLSNSARVLLHGPAAVTRLGGTANNVAAGIAIKRWGDESDLGEDLGDSNRLRDQGMIVISQSSFTSSSNYGVRVDATRRPPIVPNTGFGSLAQSIPGSPVNFPTVNTDKLAPGVVILSNVFNQNVVGGLLLSGDTSAGATDVAIPSLVARVLNNTFVGLRAGEVGIRANEGSAPTILNNIFASNQTGLDLSGVATTTTVSANLYYNNATDILGPVGQNFQLVSSATPFVANTTGGFFYPKAGSLAIDSSLNSLAELASLTQVKSTIGLPPSPALAPDRDVFGQKPLDDSTASDTSGIGANVFKDRGAIERADSTRLQAVILQPQDNDSANVDTDRTNTFIRINEGRYDYFSVLLLDGTGTGPDESTVTANSVTLTENGRLLKPGSDYIFGYDGNSHTVRLTPLAGIWRSDSVYEISFINTDGLQVAVKAGSSFADGNTIRVNFTGGPLVLELDDGTTPGIATAGAVRIPFTAADSDYQIAARVVAAINDAKKGPTAYLQGDGTFMLRGSSGVVFSNTTSGSSTAIGAIRDRAGNPLDPNRATSLTQFTIVMPDVQLDFGDAKGAGIATTAASDGARHAILPVDAPRLLLGKLVDADADGVPSPSASSDDADSLVTLGTLGTVGGATLTYNGSATIVVNRAAINDGDRFTITDTVAHPLSGVVFEFDTNATPPTDTSIVVIPVAAGDSSEDVAAKIAVAVESALKAGRLDNIIPVVDPALSNSVRFVANDGYIYNLGTGAGLSRLASGNVDITLPSSIAALNGTQFSIADDSGHVVAFQLNFYDPAVATPASSTNPVSINVPSTTAAPATSAAIASAMAAAINGQVALRNLVMSPVTVSGQSVRVLADDEDGVTFKGVFNAASNPVTVTVESTGVGMLDAWIDWNRDGDFNDAGEQFVVNQPMQNGLNTLPPLNTPASAAIGFTNVRFRLSTLGSTLTTGVAIGGEVEDYVVEIVAGNPPVAVADNYATNEDTPLDLTSISSSPIGNLSVAASIGQTQVSLSSVAGLAVGYQVMLKEGNNAEFFRVDAIAGNLVTLSGGVTRAYTTAATITAVGILGNDTDADNNPLANPPILEPMFVFDENPNTAAIDPLVNVAHGTLDLRANGTFVYTPDLDFNGTDSFTYNVVDTRLRSNKPVVVTIKVNPINDAPLAKDDTIGQAQGAFEDATIVVPGAYLTTTGPNPDVAHFRIGTGTSANASNEAGQVLRLKDGGATIISSTTTNFGNIAGLSVGVAAKPNQGLYGIRVAVQSADLGTNPGATQVSVVGTQTFTGNGSQTVFTLPKPASPLVARVLVGGVLQPQSSYTFDSVAPSLVFNTAPAAGASIVVITSSTINVTLNNHAGFVSTVNDFINALNSDLVASTLVTASLRTGAGTAVIGAPATPYAPIVVPPSGGTVTASGNQLTYVPPLHYNNSIGGPALILVTIEDDLTAGPIASDPYGLPQRLTSTSTLTVNLAAVNDRPEYDPWVGNKTVSTVEVPNDEVGAFVSIPNFITGIRPGPIEAVDEGAGPTLSGLATPPTGPENQNVDFNGLLVEALTPLSFKIQPRINVVGNTGTLEFQLAQDVNENVVAGVPYFGPILVRVTAKDSGNVGGVNNELNTSVVRTFTILPKAVNDAPEFTIQSTASSKEDQGLVTIPGFLTNLRKGPDSAKDEAVMQTLRAEYVYDPDAFLIPPSIDLVTGNLTYQTNPNLNRWTGQNWNVSVTIIDDKAGSDPGLDPILGKDRTTKSFLVDVQEFNDAPSYTMSSTLTSVDEDPFPAAGVLTTVPGFIGSIVVGPATATDEGPARENQSVRFIVTARDPSLFDGAAGLPQIEGTVDPVTGAPNPNAGTLRYRLRKDINSDAAFTPIIVDVIAVDSGLPAAPTVVQFDPLNATPRNVNASATRAFTILPNPVNDAPEFSFVTEPNMVVSSKEDEGLVTRPLINPATIFTGPAGAADERLRQTFNAPGGVTFNFDPSIFDGAAGYPTLNLTTGNVTYKTAPNVNRLTAGKNFTVSVTLTDDGGTARGGINSFTKSFTIDIEELNDAPEFNMPTSTSAFREDPFASGLTSVPNFVTGITPGPSTAVDEIGQVVIFQVDGINATTGAVDNSLFDSNVDATSGFNGFPRIVVDAGGTTATLFYRLRPDINQTVPFPKVLVRVIAIDNGKPFPLIDQFNPANTTLRNINASASRTFTVLPDPINDAPTFAINPAKIDASKPAFPTVNAVEDPSSTVTVTDFLINVLPGPSSALDELTGQQIKSPVQVEAIDASAFSQAPALVLVPDTSVPGQNRYKANLTFKPAQDVNDHTGQSLLVRFRLQDTGGTANAGDVDITNWVTFSISIAPVNDVPIFTLPIVAPDTTPVVTINEDTAYSKPFAFNIFASDLSSATDERTIAPWKQTLSFVVTSNSNSSLFSTQPSIDAVTGVLSFVPAPEQNGQAVVVVQLRDAAGPTTPDGTPVAISPQQTFTINITPINDAPEFSPGGPYLDAANNWVANSIEDEGLVERKAFATNLRVGPLLATDERNLPQQLTVHIRALDPSAFIDQPALDAGTGNLTYRTAKDVNSDPANQHDLRVEIYLTDDGLDSSLPPNNNKSVVRTFTIIPAPINDAPVFTLPSKLAEVIEDVEAFTGTSPTVFPGFATSIKQAAGLLSSPPTALDEANQVLRFDVISVSAPELFIQSTNPLLDGQPQISPNGDLSFRTAPNKNGKAVVVVRLVEPLSVSSPPPNSNASATQTFTISITPINDAPQFTIPDSVTVTEDAGLVSRNGFATDVRRGPVGSEDENSQEIRFDVTALDPSSFAVGGLPTIGVDGTLTFQTAPNVNLANANLLVRVQLFDNGAELPAPNTNASLIKTFTINATPVNDPPIPDGFGKTINEDESVTIQAIDVLVGDKPGPTADENNQLMSMTQIERTSAKGGTIIPIFNGSDIVSFQYIPPQNLVGSDTFLYVVTDTGAPARSGTGTITISLVGVNDAPQFVRGADQIVPEDSPLISVAGWATSILPGPPGAIDEINSQTVSFIPTVDKPALFEVQPAVASDGTLTFKPKANASGTAIVSLIAVDNGAIPAQSTAQLFTISITPVNDAPVFTAGPAVSVLEDSGPYSQIWATKIAPAAGLLLTPPTSTDEEGQVVDFTVVADKPSLFSVQPTIDNNGRLQFTPSRDAFGTALLTVRAVDRGPSGALDQNTSAPQTLTINITAVNDAPVAVADTLSTNENVVLTVPAPGLLQNDTDVDLPNDVISAVPVTIQSTLGAQVKINADGSITYDPSLVSSIQQLTTGQSVQDSFVYKIKDVAGLESIAATVTVNVAGVNDAPTAVNDSYTVGVGQSQFLDVLLNDSDVDSQINAATITVTSLPAFGTVVVNQTGVIQYTPGGGFRGVDTFRYTVQDTAGNVSNEAVVTVTVNNRPIAVPDTVSTVKNKEIDINVLANDSDLDGTLNPATVQIVVNPSSGTATVLPNGSIHFVPATDFSGTVTLSYVVNDDVGTVSNVANVDIRVQRSKWQNPRAALDVNADTHISPIDALLIINKLNDPNFNRDLTKSNPPTPPYLDVNGDEALSPIDALLVINYLNTIRNSSGEGEGEAQVDLSATTYAMMVTPQQMIATVGTQVVQEVQSELNEALQGSTTSSSSTGSTVSSLQGWFDDNEDDEVVDDLFCSSGDQPEKLVDAVDSYFGSIGPYAP